MRTVTHLFVAADRRDAFVDGAEWVNDGALEYVDRGRRPDGTYWAMYRDEDGDEIEVIEHFEPTCDLCDERQDESPDWNGETGNHLSCEAKAGRP